MTNSKTEDAERIRTALLRELEDAWEEAGILGLCGAGRWEYALGRARSSDLRAISDTGDGDSAPDEPGSGG